MAESKSYVTSDELKKHNKPGDLWISIQGKIYDVSDWVKDHPGGAFPLLNLSGQDATDAFVAFHPGTAWKFLDKFFNGFYLKDHSVSEVSKDYRKLVYEFNKMGLFEQKGHGVLLRMCFMAVLFCLSVYGVLCCERVLVHLICGGLMGFLWIQSGWIGHDSGHYQVMTTRGINRFAQILSGNCLAGISISWWKWNHNAHHIACNSLEFDPDLQHMPFFARSVPRRGQELLGLLVFWIWYPLLVSCLPNWGERLMFVVASFTVTGIQHVQFCLNHFSTSVYVGPPTGHDWFEKQTSGTLDILCPSWMDWFHGGLQFQTEHHLFPRLPTCQLRKISPFVKELCKKHGLPYNAASFWEANVMTCKTLRNAALQARDFTKPVPKNLVWEAVNTHG
ncbi:acyl-lipid (9-3)-desaturase-like isoform X2 [Coffea arabica]|uniref:Acyl-lipid (9-3)-desaturase-like isoform X2 n=1 Tax=Coffea arabica TaxID=13443 RepID=A0ABM4VE77_COFAR